MSKRESLKTIVPAFALLAAAVGGYALATNESTDKASVNATQYKPSQDPYAGQEVLVYAPLPLTAGESIEHFVGMDRPSTNLSDTGVERVIDELTDEYEDQTGESADEPFPGNANGTQFVSING